MTTVAPTVDQNIKFLVVCGAANVNNDSWLFSDFVAITKFLSDNLIKAEFHNSFPHKEYFNQNAHHRDIKFGRKNVYWDLIVVYKREDSLADRKWWKDWPAEDHSKFAAGVLGKVKKILTQEIEEGGTLNVVLIGHGNEGFIHLGTKNLYYDDLIKQVEERKADVTVNLIVTACYSGSLAEKVQAAGLQDVFVHAASPADKTAWSTEASSYQIGGVRIGSNRLRNSQFMAPFLDSISTWTHTLKEDARQTLKQHVNYVEQYGSNAPTGSAPLAFTSNIDLTRAVIDVLRVDYMQTALARFSNAPSRLPEPPFYTGHGIAQSATTMAMPASIATHGITQIEGFLKSEMKLFDSKKANGMEEGWYFDNYGGVFDRKLSYRDQRECIRRCVRGLGIRFRAQAVFLMAAMDLVNNGCLDGKFLAQGYSDWNGSDSTRIVRRMERILSTLRVPAALNAAMASSGEPVLGVPFSSPTKWLAITIARHGINFQDIVHRLLDLPHIGPFFDDDEVVKKELQAVVADQAPWDDFGSVKLLATTEKIVPAVGFWLEDAVSSDLMAVQALKARYGRLQQAENILGWSKDPGFFRTVGRSDAWMMEFLDNLHE
ncbi:hypothetical protein LTR17_001409 [Elasticomyces elasticus]|nr:hypothetical protein LTR17_001409 [Elasticomyces elasticus]